MSPCRTCIKRCFRFLAPELSALLQQAREHLSESEIIPPNLRRLDRDMACEDIAWAAAQDERACRLWWRLAARKSE